MKLLNVIERKAKENMTTQTSVKPNRTALLTIHKHHFLTAWSVVQFAILLPTYFVLKHNSKALHRRSKNYKIWMKEISITMSKYSFIQHNITFKGWSFSKILASPLFTLKISVLEPMILMMTLTTTTLTSWIRTKKLITSKSSHLAMVAAAYRRASASPPNTWPSKCQNTATSFALLNKASKIDTSAHEC